MTALPLVAARPGGHALTWGLAAVLLIIGVAYRSTIVTMVDLWWTIETYTHAFLVPPIALWLIWRRRERLRLLPMHPQPSMLALLLLVAAAWFVGELVAVNAVTQFALVGMLVACVPLVLGLPLARQILFPLAFLFFAVPFGEFAQPQMMVWTADFTVAALRLTGVPVYREGLHFVIPTGRWSVIETCSGTRYLIASFMVGTLFAYLNYRSPLRRWAFVAFSIAMPIVANWLRAYMVVMLGHLSNNRIAVGVDHLIYGWVFFGVVIFLMFWIGARWAEPEEPSEAASAPLQQGRVPGGGGATSAGAGAQWGTCLAAVAVACLPHLLIGALRATETTVPAVFDGAVIKAGAWAPSQGGDRVQPHFQSPASEWSGSFARGSEQAGIYVAYYRRQDYDSKLVSSQNRIIQSDDKRWHRVGRSTSAVDISGRSAEFDVHVYSEKVHITQTPTKLMTWSTFWVDGRWVSDPVWAKIWGAVGRLSGRGDDGAALVFYAVGADEADLARRLQSFVTEAGPSLVSALQASYLRR